MRKSGNVTSSVLSEGREGREKGTVDGEGFPVACSENETDSLAIDCVICMKANSNTNFQRTR